MKLKKFDLTWKKLIIFAILIGIYTGVVASLDILKNTSFQDISISFEWWILFGITIILNSKSAKDSAIKCFIFFLISQPLVYLVQVPMEGFQIFRFYKGWFVWTLFTIPMGYIGYYIKKENWLSLLILSPILAFLGIHLFDFLRETIYFFPNHLLSSIFCIATMYLYVIEICPKKTKQRIVGLIISTLIIIFCIILITIPSSKKSKTYDTMIKCSDETINFDLTSNVYLKDPSLGELKITEHDFGGGDKEYCIDASFKKEGKTNVIIETNENTYEFDLTVERNSYNIEIIKLEKELKTFLVQQKKTKK